MGQAFQPAGSPDFPVRPGATGKSPQLADNPNPLNPSRYVVLNSGPTQREFDYLNNARQVPKLPDYAVVELTTRAGLRWPGRIALAGFFGEQWQLLETHGK